MSASVSDKLAQDLQSVRDDLRQGVESLLDGISPPAAAQQALERLPDQLGEVRDRVADSAAVETLQNQAGVAADRLQWAAEEAGERAKHLRDHPVAIGVGAFALGTLVGALARRPRKKKNDPHSARLE